MRPETIGRIAALFTKGVIYGVVISSATMISNKNNREYPPVPFFETVSNLVRLYDEHKSELLTCERVQIQDDHLHA